MYYYIYYIIGFETVIYFIILHDIIAGLEDIIYHIIFLSVYSYLIFIYIFLSLISLNL